MMFTITQERTYVVDSEELKARFPDEYKEFLRSGKNDSEKAWVEDCLYSGGVELFTLMDVEAYVD